VAFEQVSMPQSREVRYRCLLAQAEAGSPIFQMRETLRISSATTA
jgi:hypothetical protein